MNAADGISKLEQEATLHRGLSIAIGGLIAAAVLVIAGYCAGGRSGPTPLPIGLANKVERHVVATAVDTAAIHQLKDVAAQLRVAQRKDSVRAGALAAKAATQERRADSLANEAALAQTARDSAAQFQAAYEASAGEVVTLHAELAAKDSEVAKATFRADTLLRALGRSESRANRADSVIAAAVAVVRTGDPPCRIAHFFGCPSRTATTVGGIVLGAIGGIAIARR